MEKEDKKRIENDLKETQRKLEKINVTINDYTFIQSQPQTEESLRIIEKRLTLAYNEKHRLEQMVELLEWLLKE